MPFRWRSVRSLVVSSFLVGPAPAYAGGASGLWADGSARARRTSRGLELSWPSEHSTCDADAETIRTEGVATAAGRVLIASVRPQRPAWTRALGSLRSAVCRCRR